MSDLVEREEVIKAIDKRICELQRHPIFKRKNADIDLYGVKKLIMRLPSARPNNRGICGVCAGRKVCGRNNRNLDMMQCSIFELDERYKISRPKGEWIAIGAVCEVICKHCIKANGCCQHHWKCPLLTEIAKLMESMPEQTEREDE